MTKSAAKRIHYPGRPALKRIGAAVRDRLADDPSVYWLPTDKAEIFAVGDFLSQAECDELMAQIDAIAKPSSTYNSSYTDAYRTSYSGNFNRDDPLIRAIDRRIDDLLGMESENGEALQGQRYLPGQEFKPHCDWFPPDDGTAWPIEKNRGGQRSFTAMAFLNDVEEGGATDFPRLGLSVTPRTGALLAWNNAGRDGTPNRDTLHAGTPVLRGVKYVLTKWYRVSRWF